MEKSFLIYPEHCIGCRSCQVACKQWNRLPAESTINRGSYENPPKLSFRTYTRIRFRELKTDQGFQWLFLKEQCYHCTEAACMLVCPVPGVIIRTEEGAIILNTDKCIGCKHCVNACPFGIPQFHPETRKVSKCNFCYDRISSGLEPACSRACPTGAIRYGDRKTLIEEANLLGYQSIYGETELQGLHVMFALQVHPEVFGLPAHPHVPAALFLWQRVCKPLLGAGGGLALLGSLLHFLVRRYAKEEET
jgi:formate dehydrogenase iron-sulfur subunit